MVLTWPRLLAQANPYYPRGRVCRAVKTRA